MTKNFLNTFKIFSNLELILHWKKFRSPSDNAKLNVPPFQNTTLVASLAIRSTCSSSSFQTGITGNIIGI